MQKYVEYLAKQRIRENKMDFTIKEKPFSWNDNFSEVALEDFSMIQKGLSYGTAQNIGMALAKLELLENQGCEVVEQKQGQWEEADDGDGIVCSVCGTDFCTLVFETDKFQYCPNCGAKMEREDDE